MDEMRLNKVSQLFLVSLPGKGALQSTDTLLFRVTESEE